MRSGIHNDFLPPARGPSIARLAGRQHGVVARTQLGVLGLDRSAIRRRVRAGTLHPVHDGRVYAIGCDPLSVSGRYLAAVMACGTGAVLSHRSAADLWGLRPNSWWLDVTATRGKNRIQGIEVHSTRMLTPQDFTVHEAIPVTTVARTLLDLSAVVRPQELAKAIDRAERLRLFDLKAVTEVLDRANGRQGARALRRAIAAYEPSTQKSELQLDGFEFHRTRRDRERDADSDADLELGGLRVMRLTWDDVTVHGERTLRRVRLAAK